MGVSWDHVDSEVRDFSTLCEGLTESEWNHASLCEGWSVHDVAVHVSAALNVNVRALVRLARLGFSIHRSNDEDIRMARDTPHSTITADLVSWRRPTGLQRLSGTPPGTALRGTMIHQQDIRRPLGRPRDIPHDRLVIVLNHLKTRVGSANLGSVPRLHQVRFVATDIDWAAGKGPEITGPGEAILMAMAGRRDALADLDGPGIAILTAQA
jgi:uncharacterized protein (TIGR03083 family)